MGTMWYMQSNSFDKHNGCDWKAWPTQCDVCARTRFLYCHSMNTANQCNGMSRRLIWFWCEKRGNGRCCFFFLFQICITIMRLDSFICFTHSHWWFWFLCFRIIEISHHISYIRSNAAIRRLSKYALFLEIYNILGIAQFVSTFYEQPRKANKCRHEVTCSLIISNKFTALFSLLHTSRLHNI